jgi:hypothetical protein
LGADAHEQAKWNEGGYVSTAGVARFFLVAGSRDVEAETGTRSRYSGIAISIRK